ncbi:MAG: DUF2061 domain-containing protein [Sedimentisphaerales bacterium]|nr:DUF2061 domain-containing protein [Sedimentisphaerales bacterium]
MDCLIVRESKRRTITKALLWRLIGIVWTWIGAYFILLLMPQKLRSASIMATAIVVYHHSTRMVMYYFYERIWNKIGWGRVDKDNPETVTISTKRMLIWIFVVVLALALIFFLILYVNPLMKK